MIPSGFTPDQQAKFDAWQKAVTAYNEGVNELHVMQSQVQTDQSSLAQFDSDYTTKRQAMVTQLNTDNSNTYTFGQHVQVDLGGAVKSTLSDFYSALMTPPGVPSGAEIIVQQKNQ